MDFLLVVLAVGGLVVAIVMLVLASRANRMQGESDERVETLQAMATGSVLFASEPQAEFFDEPLFAADAPLGTAPTSLRPHAGDANLDLALYEFADEDNEQNETPGEPAAAVATAAPAAAAPVSFAMPAAAYPFVMTVPEAAGAGRVLVSFDRNRRRSRS